MTSSGAFLKGFRCPARPTSVKASCLLLACLSTEERTLGRRQGLKGCGNLSDRACRDRWRRVRDVLTELAEQHIKIVFMSS